MVLRRKRPGVPDCLASIASRAFLKDTESQPTERHSAFQSRVADGPIFRCPKNRLQKSKARQFKLPAPRTDFERFSKKSKN
jgi:hypothetical protein